MSKIIQGYHPSWGITRIGPSKEDVTNQIGCSESDLIFTEMDKTELLLARVPVEFRSTLSFMAYQRGHSAGEEEVECILSELVSDLLPSITAFQKRLEGETK